MDQSTDKAVVTQAPQLVPAGAKVPAFNPFAKHAAEHINAGAVAIESERAVAEAQGKLVVAKRFPRDPFYAFERVMEACRRPGLAGSAFYKYDRGGQAVTGPSIRLAEELARCWGNIDYGLRELSNRDGVSEMEAYAWDLETNTMSSQKFTVRHVRDTRQGSKDLTEQRDIYELTANMGSRRLRARILAILPDDLVEAATKECRATIAGNNKEPLSERIKKMVSAFNGLGVNAAQLASYVGHDLDKLVPEQLADLQGVYTSIRDGQSKAGDWFGAAALMAPGSSVQAPAAMAAPAEPASAPAAAEQAPEKPKRTRRTKAEIEAEAAAAAPADIPPGLERPAAPAPAEPSAPADNLDIPAFLQRTPAPVQSAEQAHAAPAPAAKTAGDLF